MLKEMELASKTKQENKKATVDSSKSQTKCEKLPNAINIDEILGSLKDQTGVDFDDDMGFTPVRTVNNLLITS